MIEEAFTGKETLVFSLQTINTCTQKVSIFELKLKAQMVADGYKGLCDKQRTG